MAKRGKKKGFQPNAPTKVLWSIGLIAGILGIIGHFTKVEFVSPNAYWFVFAGFVILAIGTTFKDL